MIFLVYNIAMAQNSESPIILKDSKQLLVIGQQLDYLEDEDLSLSIKDILSPEKQVQFVRNDNILFTRSATKSAYWFRLTFQNQTQEDAWLSVATNFASYIDFYAPDSLGNYTSPYLIGTMRPEKPDYHNVLNGFWLPLSRAGDTQTKVYYVRMQSHLSFEAPMQIGTFQRLKYENQLADNLTAFFFGIMLIMFLYNIYLYISTQNHIYGLYLFYLVMNSLASSVLGGYVLLFFDQVLLYQYYVAWHTPVAISTGLFCIYYLELNKYLPTIKKLLYGFFSVLIVFAILNILGVNLVYLVDYFHNVGLGVYLICLLTSFYLVFKGHRNAIFYAIGWSFLVVSIAVGILTFSGVFPFNIFTVNSFYFGHAMEVLLFSIALADKMKLTTKEKERSQKALLEQTQKNEQLIREQNTVLEQRVEERTHELNATLQMVAKQRDDIISSINYALRIQNAIIPKESELQQYWDSFVLFRPRDIVSGDFYWLADKGKHKVLAVADCTGHGVSGAFMTMIGNTILNQIVQDYEIYSPDKILNLMPALLEKTLSHAEGTVKDGMDISILAITSLDSSKTKVTYAGAMNPLYYIENQEFKIIKADKKPIDGRKADDNFSYRKHEIINQNRLKLYLCSDGFQDQFGGEKDRKFMVKKFKRLLFEISEHPISTQKEILEKTFDDWKGNQKQTDDVLVVGIEI